MVHDLEQVLGIEAARSGEATGEATTILRSLPGRHRRLRPRAAAPPAPGARARRGRPRAGGRRDRLRGHPDREGRRRHRHAERARPERGAARVGRRQRLRPAGRRRGVPERQRAYAIDGHPPTNWETETYRAASGRTARRAWASTWTPGSRSAGRRLDVVTSTPGFKAAIYGAANGVPATIDGWTKLSPTGTVARGEALPARHAPGAASATTWCGSRTLPEGGKARIQELGLKR